MMTTNDGTILTDVSEEILATYNLVLIGPGLPVGYERERREEGIGEFIRYEGVAPSILREVQENITDLLPAGYRVVIREWNDETEQP